MSLVDDILAKLNANSGVRAAFPLEGEFYNDVIAEESSVIESSMGMPLINKALKEVMKRKIAICVFSRVTFEVPTEHTMLMEDGNGNVIGHDVPACMMDNYKDDPDIFWLCDDFAMYPHKAETEEMLIVMLPQKSKFITEADGAKNAVLLYPATTTDIMLRQHFGISPSEHGIASSILAFDPAW
ncbi:MAG: hypothetical protein LBR42_04830 [Candidatus Methanoplasma sp.]|jgi:hypothetical protein|nr:hypothetical protein [Candidatus Methanoplasma sp.]